MINQLKKRVLALFSERQMSVGEHPMFLPGRDWQIMVVCVFAINVFIVAFATYMFFEVQGRTFFSKVDAEDSQSILPLQKNDLENTVEFYEQKRDQFQSFRSQRPSTFDPFR